jgi:hypothetical protein
MLGKLNSEEAQDLLSVKWKEIVAELIESVVKAKAIQARQLVIDNEYFNLDEDALRQELIGARAKLKEAKDDYEVRMRVKTATEEDKNKFLDAQSTVDSLDEKLTKIQKARELKSKHQDTLDESVFYLKYVMENEDEIKKLISDNSNLLI